QEHMLREIDLAHAAFTEFLLQYVLAQLTGLARLPAQDLNPRTRHDRDDRGEGDEEHDLEQTDPEDRGGERTEPHAQNDEENHRARTENRDHGGAAPPRIRDERAI